jgi:F-type H+-transporting ATPase subunit epsilon|tara:strand:+ start:7715 stop:8128 length:414 start_codon:yes stop_codon:yes gene_type:complete
MATTMHCDIVSAEKSIFSGRVQMVIAAGSLGDLGIAPGHAPLLTAIIPGPVKLILESGDEEVFYVSGGFLEIQREVVTLLSDTAIRADDVDEVAAVKAVEDAEKAIANQGAEFEYSAAAAQLAEAAAQLRALRQIKK